jgi:hypothetical protein
MKNFSVQYLLSHIDNKKVVPPPPPTPITTSTLDVKSSDDIGTKMR